MASTRRQAIIAGRARRIGWEVETFSGHPELIYRITRPSDGKRIGLTKSPSDEYWEAQVMRQLNGPEKAFDKAERAYKNKVERDRRAKVTADKAAGEAALAKATKRAAAETKALQRAAGTPTEFDAAWLLTPHEQPETRRGILTPELASKLLDTIDRSLENRHQRQYRQDRENHFADIINDGEWGYTHQGMAVDSTGRMQDGQHRAGGIVATGKPQEVMISVGMPPKNYTKLDSPMQRTVRDALYQRGEAYASMLGSAARLIVLFDRFADEMYARRGKSLSIETIDNFIAANQDDLRHALDVCRYIRHDIKLVASAVTAAVFLIGRAVGRDDPRVTQFFEDVATGTNITRTDPVYLLRRWCNNRDGGQSNRYVTLALIIKTWNHRAVGRRPQTLVWRSNEWFPSTIIVPAPEDS